jgi:hypothetical protein
MAERPVLIRSRPGIKRDGTQFDGENYLDGEWCRFQRGLPRKMGGFKSVTMALLERIYGMTSFSMNNIQYLHVGSESMVQQAQVDNTGTLAFLADRTPAGFSIDVNNLWQFDVLFDTAGGNIPVLIAHAAPNLADISSSTETPIYIGDVTATTDLTDTGVASESGGIVVLAPYLLKFGNAGHVAISRPNDPSDFSSPGVPDAWVTGQKIVRGMPLRGGGQGPSGLLWSLDSLIRATFVGDTPVFAFDTISSETSILSAQGVIEYDGIYYWAGVDRFLMFNGVVREIPNDMNLNWFYDGLNYTWRQKVFAFKVPRFGEIWWCYPRGSATECTHAVIFNVRENTWYDTELPGTGRSAGIYAKVYSKPFMVDVDLTATGYTLWQHETGVNAIKGASVEPVPSSFQTAEISFLTTQDPADKSMHCAVIEPDFVQSGDLAVQVKGRANPRAAEQDGELFTFAETATAGEPQTQVVNMRELRRLMSFEFSSNTPDGDYQMGKTLGHVAAADGRKTQ